MKTILVLEDNEAILQSVENYLRLNDYNVICCSSCEDAGTVLETHKPQLAIVDISLPDGNGFFFAREHLSIRNIPFLFLTSQTHESDRITGLELGALDYVSKPFSLKELIMRVNAILNRVKSPKQSSSSAQVWKSDGDILEYKSQIHKVSINGENTHLTTTEWEILSALIQNEGSILSRDQIQKSLHNLDSEMNPKTIDSHIRNLRNKLGKSQWILAVRGFGFRFTGESLS